ncbi:unnamed protein product, partial [Rhizoctonia solani]
SETKRARNLVVCVDGTSNKFSEKNTHVVKLQNCLKTDEYQKTYYGSGVGTFAKPSRSPVASFMQSVISVVDLCIAWGLKDGILDAYRWLADTYQPEDQIFLFGFSRGAYQVRVLAAMIECLGLIHAGNQKQIPHAWELYSSQKMDEQNDSTMISEFKRTLSRTVQIHFLGAWDTVSSVGVIRKKLLPSSMKNRHIKHFRHALALDERRVKFLPEFATDVSGGINTSKNVWFVGTHSDIGGMKNHTLSVYGAESLNWMLDEAKELGLELRRHDVQARLPPPKHPKFKDLGIWWIAECLPIRRASPKPGKELNYSWSPHLGKGRRLMNGHKLHWSVFASYQTGHRSLAVMKRSATSADQLNFEQIMEKQSEFCQDGYDNIEVLHLVQYIQKFAQDSDREDAYTVLTKILKFANAGKASIVWIYGGPELLVKIISMAGDDDITGSIYEGIVHAVLTPRYNNNWNNGTITRSQGTAINVELGPKNLLDIIDHVVLPRLHDLFKLCRSELQSAYSSRKSTAKFSVIPRSKISKPEQKSDGPFKLNAHARKSNWGMDEESIYIKEIPLLLMDPPKPKDQENKKDIAELSSLLAKKVVKFIGEASKQANGRQKLCDGDVMQKLLPWITHWNPQTEDVTPEMIATIKELAGDRMNKP